MADSCMCCPTTPTCLTPPWVALPMYCCHPIAPPNQDPPDDLSTNRPQQAAICSTEKANKNKQTKTKQQKKKTLKPYDQRRISANHTPPSLRFPPAFQFPADFKDDCVLIQNPARFYPTETVTSQMSLSLGLDLRPGHWREAAAQSSQPLEAGEFPLGAVRLTPAPPSLEPRIPGNRIEPTN